MTDRCARLHSLVGDRILKELGKVKAFIHLWGIAPLATQGKRLYRLVSDRLLKQLSIALVVSRLLEYLSASNIK